MCCTERKMDSYKNRVNCYRIPIQHRIWLRLMMVLVENNSQKQLISHKLKVGRRLKRMIKLADDLNK